MNNYNHMKYDLKCQFPLQEHLQLADSKHHKFYDKHFEYRNFQNFCIVYCNSINSIYIK